MCCTRLIMCIVIIVLLIGLLFGFGVFNDGYKKFRTLLNVQKCDLRYPCTRPFVVYAPPPSPF
ncbi:hypothetical protein ACOSP7_032464 [Xanthoceras sorbifolium]